MDLRESHGLPSRVHRSDEHVFLSLVLMQVITFLVKKKKMVQQLMQLLQLYVLIHGDEMPHDDVRDDVVMMLLWLWWLLLKYDHCYGYDLLD